MALLQKHQYHPLSWAETLTLYHPLSWAETRTLYHPLSWAETRTLSRRPAVYLGPKHSRKRSLVPFAWTAFSKLLDLQFQSRDEK